MAAMIDHLTLTVRDVQKTRAFLEKVLAPLGYSVRMTFESFVGFGDEKKPYLWLKPGDPPSRPMHLAFRARTRAQVDAFHAAALAAGGQDNGAPDLRPQYHPSYYGAFVLDPEGNNVEAVSHRPE